MKKYLTLIILLSFYTSVAHSAFYIGAKAGRMQISNDIPFDDATSLGLSLGTKIQDSGFAIEGEFTSTISDSAHKTISGADLEIFTLAGYGVYRSSGDFYFKGKGGLIYQYLSISGPYLPIEGEDIGLSLGVGGGFRIAHDTALELEYTIIESDIAFISLGIVFEF